MRQHEISCDAIKAITNPVSHIFVGEMTEA